MEMQATDLKETFANIEKTKKDLNYQAKTKIEEGLKIFCKWFKENQNCLLKLEDAKQ